MPGHAPSTNPFAARLSRLPRVLLASWVLAWCLNAAVAVLRPSSSPDSDRYQRIALNLAHGHGYSASEQSPYLPDVLRAPLYPAFLAAVVKVAGPHWTLARLLQALLLTTLIPLGWLLARDCFDRATANVTAVLAALYPYYWLYSGQLLSDGLACVVTALAALLLWRSLQSGTLGQAALAGAACGAMCLLKPVMLLFPVAALVLYSLKRRELIRWPLLGAVYIAGALVVVTPWTVRNYAVTGRLIPVTAGKGLMLYQIARYAAEGLTMREYHERVQCADPRIITAQKAADPAVTTRLDQELTAAGRDLIRAHPWPYLRTILKTPLTLWLNLYSFEGATLIVSPKHLALSLLYLLPALLGLWLSRARLRAAAVPLSFLVYLSLSHMPVWSEPRQSLPGRLFLLMFMAVTLVAAYRACRRQEAAA